MIFPHMMHFAPWHLLGHHWPPGGRVPKDGLQLVARRTENSRYGISSCGSSMKFHQLISCLLQSGD